jgi:hypothetical protein
MTTTSNTRLLIALIVAVLAGCASPTPPDERSAAVDGEPEAESETTQEATDMKERHTTLTGVLTIDPISMGKRFQGTWLRTGDTDYVITYRARARYLPFQGKRVVVTGEAYRPGPNVQHIQAEHLRIETIELADGETPHSPPPEGVLPPPVVTNRAELGEVTKWAVVIGQPEDVQSDGDMWHTATLRLEDGTVLRMSGLREVDVEPGERTFVGVVAGGDDALSFSVHRSWPGRDPLAGLDLDAEPSPKAAED